MSLLAEELVEEWLNRNGYFTIRGIKLGVHEIDLLAIGHPSSEIERRHVEVTASVRPIGYLTSVSREVQRTTGRKAGSVKRRTPAELEAAVQEWVRKKFLRPEKEQLRQRLAPGKWSFELVVHRIRYPEELDLIRNAGIRVHYLADIVEELRKPESIIPSAAGTDLCELVSLGLGDKQ